MSDTLWQVQSALRARRRRTGQTVRLYKLCTPSSPPLVRAKRDISFQRPVRQSTHGVHSLRLYFNGRSHHWSLTTSLSRLRSDCGKQSVASVRAPLCDLKILQRTTAFWETLRIWLLHSPFPVVEQREMAAL